MDEEPQLEEVKETDVEKREREWEEEEEAIIREELLKILSR